jgi:uncharacterized membrane protein
VFAARFAVALAVLAAVVTVVGALLAPPDPFTQVRVVGAGLVVAVPFAYVLARRA